MSLSFPLSGQIKPLNEKKRIQISFGASCINQVQLNPDISLHITFKASLLQGSGLALFTSALVTHNYSL